MQSYREDISFLFYASSQRMEVSESFLSHCPTFLLPNKPESSHILPSLLSKWHAGHFSGPRCLLLALTSVCSFLPQIQFISSYCQV